MKNLKGEICLGRHVLQGFVIETAQEYWKVRKRIEKALKNSKQVILIIQEA
jgi:hypothetical protein